jgi:bifunctional UDP-N-acetylglucosamine pyrophosphorylase/glucosamine-1-phosphate N-acetyltransferase
MPSQEPTPLASIVLAAGKGTRMKSERAKVLHPLLGRPMLFYILDALQEVQVERTVLVIGHEADQVRQVCGPAHRYAEQTLQRGTGHAVLTALPSLEDFEGRVLILYGDMPLLTGAVLQELYAAHLASGDDLTILTADAPELRDFGRIVRLPDGHVERIVEARDCDPAEYALREVNLGAYCAKVGLLREFLPQIGSQNAQNEIYLTDLVALASAAGRPVGALQTADLESSLGVNNRADLAQAGLVLNRRMLHRMMLDGVTVLDPGSTWVEPGVRVGPDTEILPGTMLSGQTVIGTGCVLGPHTRIVDSRVGNRVRIQHSVLLQAEVEDEATVGPFAYLRPDSRIGPGARVGDFVEIKNSVIGAGAKIPHLSYVGDAEVGSRANIGCGTITCNYDGTAKHRTLIGEGAFIGSNTSLVAPVRIGAGAATGAGSVVVRDVPAGALVAGVPARPMRRRDEACHSADGQAPNRGEES